MSVRKREWTTGAGEKKEAWIVDYVDQQGERHIETFERKKEADAYHATVAVDVRQGVHTPETRASPLPRRRRLDQRVEATGASEPRFGNIASTSICTSCRGSAATKLANLTYAADRTRFRDELLASCRGRWPRRC